MNRQDFKTFFSNGSINLQVWANSAQTGKRHRVPATFDLFNSMEPEAILDCMDGLMTVPNSKLEVMEILSCLCTRKFWKKDNKLESLRSKLDTAMETYVENFDTGIVPVNSPAAIFYLMHTEASLNRGALTLEEYLNRFDNLQTRYSELFSKRKIMGL